MEFILRRLILFFVAVVTGIQGHVTDYFQDGGLNLRVEVPHFVKVGDTAVLKCLYDLGNEQLYTVKWYKGTKEFYRYTPKESPPIKSFSIVGLQIDLSRSDATQLTLKKVDQNTTARYSCEVTVDYPEFYTEIKTAPLRVVAFPEHRPEILLSKRQLAVNDILDANCSSYRSKPAANLTWLINGHLANPLYLTAAQTRRDLGYTETSILGLRFIITPSHFVNGKLTLGCIAEIYNIYHHSTETTILEEDRPKISSVVDNSSSSSSASSKGTNHYRSSGLVRRGSSFDYILSLGSWRAFSSALMHTFSFIILNLSVVGLL